MWRPHILLPKPGTLFHPEAVLLVDNGKPEIAEPYLRFNQGMGSHQQMYLSGRGPFQNVCPTASRHITGKQFHTHRHVAE